MKNKWLPIIVFYVIAVVIRALALQLDTPGEANLTYFLIDWATGIGPCIGTMWFFWHINLSFTVNSLIFLAILVFGAWGIGKIAKDTHSLVACACFHTLYNFSIHGFFQFTPAVIGIYVAVVVSWFLIWYVPWQKLIRK